MSNKSDEVKPFHVQVDEVLSILKSSYDFGLIDDHSPELLASFTDTVIKIIPHMVGLYASQLHGIIEFLSKNKDEVVHFVKLAEIFLPKLQDLGLKISSAIHVANAIINADPSIKASAKQCADIVTDKMLLCSGKKIIDGEDQ